MEKQSNGLKIPLIAATILSLASANPVHASAKACDSFFHTFAEDSEFIVKGWSQVDQNALRAAGVDIMLVEQTLKKIAGDDDVVVLPLTEERFTLPTETSADWTSAVVELTEPRTIQLNSLTDSQKRKLLPANFFDLETAQERIPKSLIVRDAKRNNLFRIDLEGRASLHEQFVGAVLQSIELPTGTKYSLENVDRDRLTAAVRFRVDAEAAVLIFRDFFNVRFKTSSSIDLPMMAANSNRGSLSVENSYRTVKRAVLELSATHGQTPFANLTFRACAAVIDNNANEDRSGDSPQSGGIGTRFNPDGRYWETINNVEVEETGPGTARLKITVPSFEREEPDTGFFNAISNVFLDDDDNIEIRLIAADANGILYQGTTKHYVTSRFYSFLAGLFGFVVAYSMLVYFRQIRRKTQQGGAEKMSWIKTISPLELIRGHNGTASLSNLQILWWSLAIFSLMIFVWIATGRLASLNQTILYLLGVTGGGSLAAKTVAMLNQNRTAAGAVTVPVRQMSWWDLVSDDGQLNLTKFQMLIFTIFTGLYVVSTVIGQITFPEIPNELLLLMGISNGIYVLGKVDLTNPHVNLAGLKVQRDLLTSEITRTNDQITELKNKISQSPESTEINESQDTINRSTDRLNELKAELEAVEAKIKTAEAAIETAQAGKPASPH